MSDSHDTAAPAYRLAVVLPLANEESTIVALLDELTAELGPADHVFCVLDNVCTDRTRDLVEAYGERDERVTVVWAPENQSVVDAYFRGYRAAHESGCEFILEMDAGFSHRPDELSRFRDLLGTGVDYIGGSRFLEGGRHLGSLRRYIVSRGGSILANLLLGTKMTDMTSGYQLFSREALQCVLTHGVRSRAHFFQTEIRFLMHQFHWREVPITYDTTSKPPGTDSLLDALKNLLRLAREARRRPIEAPQ